MRDLQQASPLAGASSSWHWVSRLHFPRGRRVTLTDLSRVMNDEPSCSASEEEGELGVFCSSEEEGEVGFSVGVR